MAARSHRVPYPARPVFGRAFPTTRRLPLYTLILLAASTLAATGGAAADAPTVCLETTITESGRTRGTAIVEGSGNRRDDRGAKRYLKVLNFGAMPLGVTPGQTGHAIVKVIGPDTWSVVVTDGTALYESCDAARAALTSAPSPPSPPSG